MYSVTSQGTRQHGLHSVTGVGSGPREEKLVVSPPHAESSRHYCLTKKGRSVVVGHRKHRGK